MIRRLWAVWSAWFWGLERGGRPEDMNLKTRHSVPCVWNHCEKLQSRAEINIKKKTSDQ